MRPPTELALLLACFPAVLAAQGRNVELVYGRWYQGNRATTYELRTDAPLGRAGSFSHGFAVQALGSNGKVIGTSKPFNSGTRPSAGGSSGTSSTPPLVGGY